MKLGILTTGAAVVTTFDLNYVPERVGFTAATQLTGFRCEVLGEGVICDLDANGITAIGRHRVLGLQATSYLIPLADGVVTGKTVRFTFTNSAAATPEIYVFGDNVGSIYIRSLKGTVLLNTNQTFNKFGAMFFPSLAAGDKVTETYEDGLVQIMEAIDLTFRSALIQQTPQIQVDNLEGKLKAINANVAATQTVYIVDFIPAKLT